MDDIKTSALLRHGDKEEILSLLKVIMNYTGKIGIQTELAVIDLLACNIPDIQKRSIDIIVSKGWIPVTAMKIGFEFRKRALYENETYGPFDQLIQKFEKSPVLGKANAQTALDYLNSYPLDDNSKEIFKHTFLYFTRDEPTISSQE